MTNFESLKELQQLQGLREPSKLLILTNSLDGSSDVIVKICKDLSIDVFRFNVDLFEHYEIRVTAEVFEISDPVGRVVNVNDAQTKMLWRKPFLDTVVWPAQPDVEPIVKGNVSAVLRSIVTIHSRRSKSMLVRPFFDDSLTKLIQLADAKSLFDVPDYEFSIKAPRLLSGEVVVKPLRESSSTSKSVFYTAKAKVEDLVRPFPWFTQVPIFEGRDITGVYIDGKTWFYECEFNRSPESVDWRVEINSDVQSRWKPWGLGEATELQFRVHNLMERWGLRYGRLDFIVDVSGKLWFLECNPNGQFGWLDDEDLTLHKAFLSSALR